MLSEVVTCNCVRNPGGHAESNPRPSEEGVSFYHVLRPLDQNVCMCVCMYVYMYVCMHVSCAAVVYINRCHIVGGVSEFRPLQPSQVRMLWSQVVLSGEAGWVSQTTL